MSYNTPDQIAVEFCKNGAIKARMPFYRFALLAILGGAFIAFGGLLTVVVAGGMPGVGAANPGLVKFVAGALFPVGLIMVVVAGGDLFTSDCAGTALAYYQKEISLGDVIRVLVLSFGFNFIGALVVAYFFAWRTGLIGSSPWMDYLHTLAEGKVSRDFLTVFLKGIGANFLVCLGVWMGYAAKDITGKAIGIWIPVMIFVTFGYEHSIANMFFLPAAIFSGAEITWWQFATVNLLPATLGNLVGGGLLVALVYWFVYLKKSNA